MSWAEPMIIEDWDLPKMDPERLKQWMANVQPCELGAYVYAGPNLDSHWLELPKRGGAQ